MLARIYQGVYYAMLRQYASWNTREGFTNQSIAAFQFFDTSIDKIEQSSLTGKHGICHLHVYLDNIDL